MRLPSLSRFFAFLAPLVITALLFVVLAPGCGRSSLEVETFDASVDGPSPGNCGPSTCSSGCCDSSGVCRVGRDTQACGAGGGRCNDCVANGFQFCDARQVCGRNVGSCVTDCPGGCCSSNGGVNTCLSGTDPSACGFSGTVCTDCTAQGRVCDPMTRSCGAGQCDATNCKGCCVGDKCLTGTDQQACGRSGQLCASCQNMGQVCRPDPFSGGQCTGMPTCGPQNCGGCCLGNICVAGGDSSACGKQGMACANCMAQGKTCVPQGQPNERTCQTPVTCNAATCPGCCVGNNCVLMTTPAACGKGGQTCIACPPNDTCTAGVCVPAPKCSPLNCAGCCTSMDTCAVGNQDAFCGLMGVACNNCTGIGRVCQGGACQPPVCGPGNCAGCCSGNTCVLGSQDNACGANGAACTDCTPGNQVCQGRVCRARCGAANCTGCCTPGNACALGFTNGACGSGGAACVNCVAAGSTCDTLVVPRVCANQQNKCPAPYGACAPAVTTPVTPSLQALCDDVADLDPVQAACAGGPNTGTCIAAFQVLAAANPACGTCLTPFDVDFQQARGIYRCVAPFVPAPCNHTTGCAIDCQDTSCNQCPAGSEDQCRTNVDNGQCGPFIQQTLACVAPAAAPGSLCSPATYAFNFGRWLRAVGAHYCGNGP